jgi:ferric-dicitrate binding protein FerR (iron transport regulator)
MLNENDIERLITAYLRGSATANERLELEEWVTESPEHLRDYREFVNLWQVTHPAFDPEGIHVAQARERVLKKITPPPSPVYRMWIYWQRTAAIALVPLLLLCVYFWIATPREPEAYDGIEYQELKSPYGTFSQIELPDGSKVWLNGGSRLKYPLKFRPGERQVFLEGEGYFEVCSDRKNPFVVQTEQMTLTAVGTSFNVEAFATDSLTFVTMAGGMANVAVVGKAEPVTLNNGDRLVYNSRTLKGSLAKTDPYKWYAWKDGQMIFRNDPLQYVFKRLEHTFHVDIVVKDQTLGEEPYRAGFESESLDEILRLLEMSAPIRFVQVKRTLTSDHRYEKQRIEVYRRKNR